MKSSEDTPIVSLERTNEIPYEGQFTVGAIGAAAVCEIVSVVTQTPVLEQVGGTCAFAGLLALGHLAVVGIKKLQYERDSN